MNDFISFMAFMLLGYLCCIGFVVAMVRVFFPLKTEEERTRINEVKTPVQNHERMATIRSMSMKQTGQLA